MAHSIRSESYEQLRISFAGEGDVVDDTYFPTQKPVELRIKNKHIRVTREEVTKSNIIFPPEVRTELSFVSQLGLKEFWIGKSDTLHRHTREVHSRRTFNVGYIWLRVLQETVSPERIKYPFQDWDDIFAVVSHALLLHDIGHLPFSHLLDEVLATINWRPRSAGRGGLEIPVIQRRFDSSDLGNVLLQVWERIQSELGLKRPEDGRAIVENLIQGTFGIPWIQTIVNSPIDADKIDYIHFDSNLLHQSESFPVHARIQRSANTPQWFEEFLQDQDVNHTGLLCLHGRSARATVDLWRDRIFLYDRFYLSPELRVPERMTSEILQQYLIRSTMSDVFRSHVIDGPDGRNGSFPSKMGNSLLNQVIDPIEEKALIVLEAMQDLRTDCRHSSREFNVLHERMFTHLRDWEAIDRGYREFLTCIFDILNGLKIGNRKLREVVDSSLVNEPIELHVNDYEDAREILRALQHRYCREVLIDLVRLPSVLSSPIRRRTGLGGIHEMELNYSILVPDGRIASWGPGKDAKVALCDELVTDLEQPYCRILIIAPDQQNTPRSKYIWDRVRSTLLGHGITLIERKDTM